MTRQLRITLALVLLVITIAVSRVATGFSDKEVIFYPTYGFKQGTDWIIPMRAKVQEPRSAELMFNALFRHLPARDASETSRFKARIADFVADTRAVRTCGFSTTATRSRRNTVSRTRTGDFRRRTRTAWSKAP